MGCVLASMGCSEAPAAGADGGAVDAATAADAGGLVDAPVATDAGPPPTGAQGFDPRERGPFGVGYRTATYTYTPAGAAAPRTLPLHLWYPTWNAPPGPRPNYAGLFRDPESVTDAPPAAPVHPGGYPVVVFSHGHQGFAGNAHFLMRWMAAQGWVAIAPDHVGNTLRDTPSPLPAAIFHLRARDASAALDALSAAPLRDALAGPIRTDRALLVGHSAGAHTTWAAAGATYDADAVAARCAGPNPCREGDREAFQMGQRDPRFVAVVPMAGTIRREWFGPTGHRTVAVPVLALSGSDDPVGADTQYTSTEPLPLTWVDIRGGCHQFFGFGGCMNAPDALQGPIAGAWVLAFGRRWVLDDTSPVVEGIVSGSMSVSERVTLRRR